MKNNDILLQRLCLMLAFQSVVANGKINENGNVERIIDLARKMDEFVQLHLADAFKDGTGKA